MDSQDYNQMRWASRRGLLELDLLLAPFVEDCYRQLSDVSKADYRRLMGSEDQDLLNWIMDRSPISDGTLIDIIKQIREHNRRQGEAKR